MGNPKFQQDWRKPLVTIQTATIHVGRILYFSTNKLIDPTNNEPHYFIIVAIDGDTVYFLCCQSSEVSANNQVKYKGKDPCTIPCLKPTVNNELKKESYVDCNYAIDYSFQELTQMFDDDKIVPKGVVSLSDYYQLKYGIVQSLTNDLPEEILVHPED